MNLPELYRILQQTTIELRNGETVTRSKVGAMEVITIDAMPAANDAAADGLEKIDLALVTIGVDKKRAEDLKEQLIRLLASLPEPRKLTTGVDYIEIGAVIGDQGAALRLFALGKVLGLWHLLTPASIGADGEDARRLAGSGFIVISGMVLP